jgi:hypothetical protein
LSFIKNDEISRFEELDLGGCKCRLELELGDSISSKTNFGHKNLDPEPDLGQQMPVRTQDPKLNIKA